MKSIPAFFLLLALCHAAAWPSAGATSGAIDPAFPPTNVGYGVLKLALQSNSGILAAGTTKFDGTASATNLLRLQTNGTIDPSFTALQLAGSVLDLGGGVTFPVPPTLTALFVQADDKILVGGTFERVNGTPRTNLARLNANGAIDAAFTAPVNNSVAAIVPLPGGKYLIGGAFDKIGGVARKNLARLNADGSLDGAFSFTWAGAILGGPIFAIAIQPDGKVVAAGTITKFAGSVGAVALVRFNADGTLDSTFTPPALAALTQQANGLLLQADGSIIVSGTFPSLNGTARSDLAKLSSSGIVDPVWGGAGSQGNSLTDHVKAMIRQPDGKIVLGGTFGKFSDVVQKGFVRLNSDGSIDSSLAYTDGSTTWASAIALQPDGKIVAGGTFTLGAQTFTLLRILGADGGSETPVITTQPAGQTVNVGATVTLSVVATGGATLTYQWFRDGTPLNGETHTTLSLFNIQSAQAGSYHVTVSNGTKTAESTPAVVVVNSPPVVTAQPQPLAVSIGASAKFSVTASGTAPLSYQWQFNGVALPNETGATLTLSNVQPGQAGKYKVIVHNALGDTPSAEVTLAVTIPPPAITRQPLSQTVTASANVALPACGNLSGVNLPGAVLTMTVREGAAPFANSGSYSVTLGQGAAYHLTANGINPARDGTWSFGPDLGIATVLTVNNYFGDSRITHWALLANCEYELYADNLVSSQGGTYTVRGGTSNTASNVTFTVEATGAGTLTFQWSHNGVPIDGATQSSLSIPATAENAGTYLVVVTNGGGSTPSEPAVLTIDTPVAQAALQFTTSNGKLNLSWPAGHSLQSSASLSAPSWTIIATASPQSVATTGPQQYFRLVKQ